MKTTNRIDVHHHIIPDVYRNSLLKLGVDRSAGAQIQPWTPERSLEFMKKAGVETAICSISEPALNPIMAVNPEEGIRVARETNEFMAELCKEYPGKFGAFALLPMPDVEASVKEIEYALDVLKLDGVGLLSNYGEAFVGNREFEPVFQALQDRGAVIYLHPSTPPASYKRPEFVTVDFFEEFTFSTTRAAANLMFSGTMDRCPDIKIILSHMGGCLPYIRWRLHVCWKGLAKDMPKQFRSLPVAPYVYDTWDTINEMPAESMARFYYDTALAPHKLAFDAVEEAAPHHTLFGTDSFFCAEGLSLAFGSIIEECLDGDRLHEVNRGAAEKLFPRFAE